MSKIKVEKAKTDWSRSAIWCRINLQTIGMGLVCDRRVGPAGRKGRFEMNQVGGGEYRGHRKSGLQSRFNRVDLQVSLIVAGIVAVSFFVIYLYNYFVTYNDMIYSLKERSDSIYTYVEQILDKDTFYDIETRSDMDKNCYRVIKRQLHEVKIATGVMYLYTAKKTGDGRFIYVVDGLSQGSEDFRYPGDPIENETIPELERALGDEKVYPKSIKETSWGHIFVAYYPVHGEDGQVVGAVGIEFDAGHQYDTFWKVRIFTPVIGILFCLFAVMLSSRLFRRISNPMYKDFASTDYLTNLKNRNAFELENSNLKTKPQAWEGCGLLVADLNGLKRINDTYGHQSGDEYIIGCAEVLRACVRQPEFIYRVGGDEFVIILHNTSVDQLQEILRCIETAARAVRFAWDQSLSMAIGYALYDETMDACILDTYRRADRQMYDTKKMQRGLRAEACDTPERGGQ